MGNNKGIRVVERKAMIILTSKKEIRNKILSQKQLNKKIALVPTMGGLHEGHLSLVKRAKLENDIVVVSLFVNPTQFVAGEDFDKYPRVLDKDLSLLKVVFVFVPNTAEIYSYTGLSFVIKNLDIFSENLCGKFRKGHFDGVLTIVMKLFNICLPDKAYFGEKDYQQYLLIKGMVNFFNMNVEIVPCELVRGKDGLALSSRNVYLSEENREKSLIISKTLFEINNKIFFNKINDISKLKKIALELLLPYINVQYVEFISLNDYSVLTKNIKNNCLFAIAGYSDNTRLIDNIVIKG